MTQKWKFRLYGFLLGLATSVVWAAYIRETSGRHAGPAAIADLLLMFGSSVGTQLWANAERDFFVFLGWDIGAALGTYLWVGYGL